MSASVKPRRTICHGGHCGQTDMGGMEPRLLVQQALTHPRQWPCRGACLLDRRVGGFYNRRRDRCLTAKGGRMKTLIQGGWVVAFNGTEHEVYENGAVVYEDDQIVHAGGAYRGTVDTRIEAAGKLISPGFINTHVHTSSNVGDY